MTHDHVAFTDESLDYIDQIHILWTRPPYRPDHWTAEAVGTIEQVENVHAAVTVAFPGLEKVILPALTPPCIKMTH